MEWNDYSYFPITVLYKVFYSSYLLITVFIYFFKCFYQAFPSAQIWGGVAELPCFGRLRTKRRLPSAQTHYSEYSCIALSQGRGENPTLFIVIQRQHKVTLRIDPVCRWRIPGHGAERGKAARPRPRPPPAPLLLTLWAPCWTAPTPCPSSPPPRPVKLPRCLIARPPWWDFLFPGQNKRTAVSVGLIHLLLFSFSRSWAGSGEKRKRKWVVTSSHGLPNGERSWPGSRPPRSSR